MNTQKKYFQNLKIEDGYVYSYSTQVAKIETDYIQPLGWWSVTTSKHINYAASLLGLPVKK